MEKPTILIIAGGKNSRFAPLNNKTHKGFLSLAGKPIIARALENLVDNNFEKVILVVSARDFDGHGFSHYLQNLKAVDPNSKINQLQIQVVLQKEANGMADALLSAKDYLDQSFILASPYYVNLGDIAEQLWTKKQESGADCVYSGTQTDNPSLYGILEFDPSNNQKVIGIIEKPPENQTPSNIKIDSIYLFDQGFLKELESHQTSEYVLEETINSYAKKSLSTWIEDHHKIQSLKYPWHLFNLLENVFLSSRTNISNSAKIASTAILDDKKGAIVIDENAKIGDFVKICGPCYIGKNALVGDYSFVRESSLEENAVCGANTEIVRSILFESSSIHYGYLADSIIGHGTKIGAGLISANKRLDRKNIKIMVKNTLIDTQKRALGLITGENVNIGIKTSTMPGTVIESSAIIAPNSNLKRNISE